MTIASRRFTRWPRVPSPDKNEESVGSGIDRPRGRPLAFALPKAIGSQMSRPPDLLLRSIRSSAVPETSDPMEERRW